MRHLELSFSFLPPTCESYTDATLALFPFPWPVEQKKKFNVREGAEWVAAEFKKFPFHGPRVADGGG